MFTIMSLRFGFAGCLLLFLSIILTIPCYSETNKKDLIKLSNGRLVPTLSLR